MAMWNPWRGCHKYSEGCKYCYIHKGDYKRKINTNLVTKAKNFDYPMQKLKNGKYKLKSGQTVYLCFSTDFLIEEADSWRNECWNIINERKDLHFIFLTKRIERFLDCIPTNWGDGYDNVTVGCTIENQELADYRLSIFNKLPIKHKNIICQPLIENINIEKYLTNIELVVVGGESDYNARPLNYDWVLNIRNQCINRNTNFEFRQCGTNFIKDGKSYKLNKKTLCSQARKANINYSNKI
ncbi:phage Gp37/Gp68 family protein [Peptostreptococcaceae bacterium OttesenSCG-928-C18]|nr:phage Gp37/Gp68 family protein [Peptostreptococcaceae bacterium OttesenSCG-928-C18]